MEIKKYRVFWEALVIALFIFGLGFVFGLLLENNRSQQISLELLSSENALLDARNLFDNLAATELDCNYLIEKNREFGDKIYYDAIKLGNYERSIQINKNTITEQHRKYDILRTIFWQNSIKIKEKCPGKFSTLVYVYDYNSQDLEEQSKQKVFSNFLTETKDRLGGEIVLIPIAKNLDILSLDLMLQKYQLNSTAIIFNEQKVFDEPAQLDLLREEIALGSSSLKLN